MLVFTWYIPDIYRLYVNVGDIAGIYHTKTSMGLFSTSHVPPSTGHIPGYNRYISGPSSDPALYPFEPLQQNIPMKTINSELVPWLIAKEGFNFGAAARRAWGEARRCARRDWRDEEGVGAGVGRRLLVPVLNRALQRRSASIWNRCVKASQLHSELSRAAAGAAVPRVSTVLEGHPGAGRDEDQIKIYPAS